MAFNWTLAVLLTGVATVLALVPVRQPSLPVRAPSPISKLAVLQAASSSAESGGKTDSFEYYTAIYERCSRIQALESDFLLGFWSPKLKCFNIQPNNAATTQRVSITSTCLAIHSMLQSPDHWRKVASWEPSDSVTISLQEVVASLRKTPWSGDAFQTPVLVQTLCMLRAIDKDDPAYVDLVEKILAQRSRLSLHRQQPNSAYLRYHNVRALLAVVDNQMVPTSIVGSDRIGYALERANMVAYDELSRQLAFSLSDDSGNFDVIVLAYSLLAYWESSQSLFLGSFARGVVPPTNIKLVKSALKVIFSHQSSDGTWRKGEPIFKTTGEYNGKRDIGNAYVFFFDLVGALLGPLAKAHPELLAPYLPNFERCLSWAETNVLQEMLPEVCDEVTRRCVGTVVRGWRSNHLDTGGAVAWCTAQVFFAVAELSGLLKTFISSSVLSEFSGRRSDSLAGAMSGTASFNSQFSSRAWDGLMDTDLELGGERTTLKSALLPRLLQPQLEKHRALDSALTPRSMQNNLAKLSSFPPIYSLILFGPPGTAKTTICSAMASFLGWNFLTIDTACFLADGLEHIAARMSYIFDRLRALEKTIILFDEIEEFCLDRENPALGMESRLLTTAILTQLNALRAKQANIFIVATNRLRSFDAAVTRPGRFDLLLFVGTPNLDSRVRRLVSKLEGTSLPHEAQCDAAAAFQALMEERWDVLRFLTFAENEALLNAVLDLYLRQETAAASATGAADVAPQVTIRAALAAKVESIQRTATIQGQVRDEYVASESLSRL